MFEIRQSRVAIIELDIGYKEELDRAIRVNHYPIKKRELISVLIRDRELSTLSNQKIYEKLIDIFDEVLVKEAEYIEFEYVNN